ncbi:CDP-diacylglycerol--glycerol-3-phosphate 3-phosphatidyltransferase [Rickettsiales endosymbiont of Stachyamoeba lipophora]|uniref:CDP-diacylglycerol--glycerol-3-phosphate 3-phosphatidyltransferase n=1 Tax=Rickettsiales endosymbiont of Stachyamoeba lipophora TaxID=2486578 RepID=UPI000F64870A|nr:CDP-diacylglycerol--glycerol-3-phosphate 3-phosphatidyltransferase [Rickettsiales endosymbiont of Stachyamoeba lipophora]AZL16463.1 CDP-diacylglycerol--glycerol-3-phosphate 3-phosphatidyltransferase [Rickettsiales endosymbiont of Stachyamoeba lipophora]
MLRDLPNILTISRIVAIPILILCFYAAGSDALWYQATAFIFLGCCITDFFDGYLARALSLQSKLGQILDPIADKLLVGSIIVILIDKDKMGVVPGLAIIGREILVSGLREFLAELRISVPVTNLAKIKTATQMAALFILLLGKEGSGTEFFPIIGALMSWLAAVLTVITGYAYVKAGIQHLKD